MVYYSFTIKNLQYENAADIGLKNKYEKIHFYHNYHVKILRGYYSLSPPRMRHKVMSLLLMEKTTSYRISFPVNWTLTGSPTNQQTIFPVCKGSKMQRPGWGKTDSGSQYAISVKRIGDKIRPNEQWTDTIYLHVHVYTLFIKYKDNFSYVILI